MFNLTNKMTQNISLLKFFGLILFIGTLSGCGGYVGVSPGSATVSATKGGEIIVKSADDSVTYKLVVPEGAVSATTTITITPRETIPNLPLTGGFIAGVDFAPDGLKFDVPLDLTIEVPKGFDPKRLEGFTYEGQGEKFLPASVVITGTTLKFKITHFSGAGAAQANSNDFAKMFADLKKIASNPSFSTLRSMMDFLGRWESRFPGIINSTTGREILEIASKSLVKISVKTCADGKDALQAKNPFSARFTLFPLMQSLTGLMELSDSPETLSAIGDALNCARDVIRGAINLAGEEDLRRNSVGTIELLIDLAADAELLGDVDGQNLAFEKIRLGLRNLLTVARNICKTDPNQGLEILKIILILPETDVVSIDQNILKDLEKEIQFCGLQILPLGVVAVEPGGQQRFRAISPLDDNPIAVNWMVIPETMGTIDSDGLFTAGLLAGTFEIKGSPTERPDIVATARGIIKANVGGSPGTTTLCDHFQSSIQPILDDLQRDGGKLSLSGMRSLLGLLGAEEARCPGTVSSPFGQQVMTIVVESLEHLAFEACNQAKAFIVEGQPASARLALVSLLQAVGDLMRLSDTTSDGRIQAALACAVDVIRDAITLAGAEGVQAPHTGTLQLLSNLAADAQLLGAPDDVQKLAFEKLRNGLRALLYEGNLACKTGAQIGTDVLNRRLILGVDTLSGLDASLPKEFDDAVAGCGLSIEPSSVMLGQGQTQQFTATVAGEDAPKFQWSVEGGAGRIDQDGLFTATGVGTFRVRAESVSNPGKFVIAEGIVDPKSWKAATDVSHLFSDSRLVNVPNVVMDSSGNAFAWIFGQDSRSRFIVRRFVAGIGWEATTTALSDTFVSQPQIVFNVFGNAMAVWIQGEEIMTNTFVPGAGWGTATLLAVPATPVPTPVRQVALSASGDAIVLLTGSDGGVWASECSVVVARCLTPNLIGKGYLFSLSMNLLGNAIVTWRGVSGLEASQFLVGRGWETIPAPRFHERAHSFASSFGNAMAIHLTDNDAFLDSFAFDGNRWNSSSNLFFHGFSQHSRLSSVGLSLAYDSLPAVNSSGNAILAWITKSYSVISTERADGDVDTESVDTYQLMARRQQAGSAPQNDDIILSKRISTNGSRIDIKNRKVFINDTGDIIVTWMENFYSLRLTRLKARRFLGGSWGPEITLGEAPYYSIREESQGESISKENTVFMNSSGNAIAMWLEHPYDTGSTMRIMERRFE
ncbi:MAG: Ig-like domain-containing protein [Nitrospirota bacterium]